MTFLLSASIGIVLGAINARLALNPVLISPLRMSPKALVLRFLVRILTLCAILVFLANVGVMLAVLLLGLVGGFAAQSVLLCRRTVT